MSSIRIGVLAVQGAFAEHAARLRQRGCEVVELRQRADVMQELDGLVLPGGESTVQTKLLHDLGMMEPLRHLICEGMPVLGTCAGLILMAKTVEHASDGRQLTSAHVAQAEERQTAGFCTLPVSVRRNGYGRQLGSFVTDAALDMGGGVSKIIPLTFIRAPRIMRVGPQVETLAAINGEPVLVRFGHQVGCCFHPELDADDTVYEMIFLS